jgi:hypothetical protein
MMNLDDMLAQQQNPNSSCCEVKKKLFGAALFSDQAESVEEGPLSMPYPKDMGEMNH